MSALIIGIGEALWDVLPDGKKIGGAPANFAYHVSQFGLDGCAISAIGYDVLGDEIIDVFNKKNLHYLLPRVDYPTGTVQVTLDKEGIPCYDIKRDVAWDHIPLTSEMKNLAHHAQAICFGSLSQRSLVSRTTIAEFIDEITEE